MSEQKPKPHPAISVDEVKYPTYPITVDASSMSPDEAVTLGYALFEHGLFLKGKMKAGS